MSQKEETPIRTRGKESGETTGYVAMIRTWLQVSPSDFDLVIQTKILTGLETINDLMEWAETLRVKHPNITLTKAL